MDELMILALTQKSSTSRARLIESAGTEARPRC